MLKKIGKRLQNKKVILAVTSGILLILVNLNIIDLAMSEKVDMIVNTFLGILIALGVISNPDSHIQDDQKVGQ